MRLVNQFIEKPAIGWCVPGSQGALANGFRPVRDNAIELELDDLARTLTTRTCTDGAVIPEEIDLGLDVVGPADAAAPALDERARASVEQQATAPEPSRECGLDRVESALRNVLAAHQPVDDHIDESRCSFGSTERLALRSDGRKPAVDSNPGQSILQQRPRKCREVGRGQDLD